MLMLMLILMLMLKSYCSTLLDLPFFLSSPAIPIERVGNSGLGGFSSREAAEAGAPVSPASAFSCHSCLLLCKFSSHGFSWCLLPATKEMTSPHTLRVGDTMKSM